jgi:hypothetical protein
MTETATDGSSSREVNLESSLDAFFEREGISQEVFPEGSLVVTVLGGG